MSYQDQQILYNQQNNAQSIFRNTGQMNEVYKEMMNQVSHDKLGQCSEIHSTIACL